jgi:multidrug efflux pump subunit AcrA (membrane-fusion protein)
MKRIIAALCVCVAAGAAAAAVPKAVESSVPAAKTLYPSVRDYTETVSGSGSLSYSGQNEITSSLPIVINKFCVSEGDSVSVGDVIATVDKKATTTLIESLGQVSQLAVAAANLSTAVSLIPETITADCSGRVISTAGDGASVESGYAIATVASGDSLFVTAAISELDIAAVEIGQKAVFTCAAYPDTPFTGTVSAIASAARNQYNGAVLETVVDIKVTPDSADERLKSGLSADVDVELSDPKKICVLPYEAIGQDDGGEFIYVYENGEAVRRNVFTGAEFSDGTEIIKGVSQGETVFAEPEKIAGCRFIKPE